MMLPPAERYPAAMRVLHWTVALLVLVVLPFGVVIKFIEEDVKLTFYMIHESLGFLILWIMLARLAVRLVSRVPPPVPMSPAQHIVASTVHALLYVALIAQPILGFLATNAFGFPLQWFWLFEIPSPVGHDEAIAPYFMAAHVVVGYSIVVLFVLHFGGTLFHHVVKRDETLERML